MRESIARRYDDLTHALIRSLGFNPRARHG